MVAHLRQCVPWFRAFFLRFPDGSVSISVSTALGRAILTVLTGTPLSKYVAGNWGAMTCFPANVSFERFSRFAKKTRSLLR